MFNKGNLKREKIVALSLQRNNKTFFKAAKRFSLKCGKTLF